MKFFKKLFFISILLFSTVSNAENDIFYIDIDYIIKNSNKGKTIILELEKTNKNNAQKLKTEKENLINLENDIKKQKNIINEKELKKKISDLRVKIKNFNKKKIEINDNFKKKSDMELKKFFTTIELLVKNYVEEKSIKILLDKKSIFIAKSSYDITSEILDLINKNTK
jgi:outer membrane protein